MKDLEILEIMSVPSLVQRANALGIQITPYLVRKAIIEEKIPCRIVGKTYLVPWKPFENWISCVDGSDNQLIRKRKHH